VIVLSAPKFAVISDTSKAFIFSFAITSELGVAQAEKVKTEADVTGSSLLVK
jgi:hypothetical protein